jgi:hypothetical protein
MALFFAKTVLRLKGLKKGAAGRTLSTLFFILRNPFKNKAGLDSASDYTEDFICAFCVICEITLFEISALILLIKSSSW